MYDHVKFEIECPRCKDKIVDFQSKDGSCMMWDLEFWEVDNFYSSCDSCKTWVEFTIKYEARKKLKIEDYDKKVKKTTKKDDIEEKKRQKELVELFKK